MSDNNIILKCDSILKSFTPKLVLVTNVLKGVSLEVRDGEYLAIMGPSGVGKSTLLYILGSLDKPTQGNVTYHIEDDFFDLSALSSDKISSVRNKYIGFIFQFHHLLPEFTALENIMMPAMISGDSYSGAKKKALKLIEQVGVAQRSEHKPMELSGGEQQRVAIARALINNPKIVLADEPTGNLDTKNADSILKLVDDLRKEYNLTFIVATHSNDVANIADRILFMSDGVISQEKILRS